MDRDWLACELEAGRSIEALARELGRSASTVSYWVRKHGLRSAHARRHEGNGGIERDRLADLVESGLSGRAIAEELGVSQATVRHWLARHGLRTRRSASAARRSLDDAGASGSTTGTCPAHGRTTFGRRREGGWRCLKCRAGDVARRRRKVKAILVAEAGGACVLCGYARSPAALQFHHLDPADKAFSLSFGGATRALAASRAEAAKCVLLCANCHAEVEAGVAKLPIAVRHARAAHVPG